MTNFTSTASEGLYKSEARIYPREAKGRFATLRKLAMVWLLGMFYLFPWLNWNGQQAVLFDLPARKFHIFGLTLWPQDFLYLALLLITAAIVLFFVTALAGRLWCGFACPQTVWTEAFTWVEQLVEGDRSKRMKLDKAPWSLNKLWRKSLKQFLWITLALFTGVCFVGYFTPARALANDIAHFNVAGWTAFWMLFYSFATYGNAAYMREQVCKYMCPYARFQSAMFDEDTLIITYDEARGEPRGRRKRGADVTAQGLGACVDCTMCVQVCPTGIDIREGLQYECIACAACIDACDTVMDKMAYPRGLIRYSTENAMAGQQTHVVRPRVIIYALVIAAILMAIVTSLATRQPLIVDVLRDRNALYRDLGRNGIENTYTLHIINQDSIDRDFEISVDGIPGIALTVDSRVRVAAGSLRKVPVAVRVQQAQASGGHTISFSIQALDDPTLLVHEKSRFRGPLELN